jgi:MinD-like ATPase involved in chromosome partitioning or flagellar assembly
MPDDSPVSSGHQPPQRPMWQVQPGPVSGPDGPFSPPAPPVSTAAPGQHADPYAGTAPPPGWGQQQPGAHAAPVATQAPAPAEPARVPTAQDFLAHRHRAADVGPATWGWRGWVRRLTFGLVKPKMGPAERAYREARAVVQRSFSGPRTIVFANPKGGAAKTTSVLGAGYTFGTIRGGGVVAWDNNETRGTLGIRGERANHQNTTRELLDDLERFSDVYESRIGDLGAFVRSQGDAHFDVLASDERADVTGTIRADDFSAVHRLLERFYHLILVDTGNNLRAENWLAAARAADLIVVTCTVREDTGYSGLWMLDALQDAGHAQLQDKVITVLADPSPNVDEQLAKDLVEVYGQRTRSVHRVPYDPALVAGSVIQYAQLSEETRSAWLKACAAMAEAL